MGEPTVPESFAARVAAAVAVGGPLCGGIDPSESLLDQWGLEPDAGGLRRFGLICVEAFTGVVPVVKPQVAFFERRGSAGLAALEAVMAEARAAGLLVIADAKRGDIGTTTAAYAGAWLDPDSPLGADALTAVPYLGLGSLQPLFDRAAVHGRGVIVVVRSSNPEGRVLQEARTDGGRGPAVEDMLLAQIAETNRAGPVPPGTVGAVVGATLQPSSFSLPELGGVILAPGVGAQGAGPPEVARLFAGCPPGSVLASVSRSVLSAGPDVGALATAARRVRAEMAAVLA
ncbi:MAG: orotidine-5'-phosphate decarboxylase [Acidimicrobiales bacterium]|jgi:orotidine-5'-phosphate decarboxylase